MKKNKTTDAELLLSSICDVGKKYEISREKVVELFIDSINKVLAKLYPEKIFKIYNDEKDGKIICQTEYEIIDNNIDDYDDFIQIPLDEAKKINKNAAIGEKCLIDFDIYDSQNLSKQQIIQIMQIFKQRLNELNNIKVFKDWSPKVNTIIVADVDKFDNRTNSYLIDLKDGNFGFLSKNETIPGENLKPGEKYQFLVKEVKEHSKGWPVILSRADEKFVEKLLEENVPEIASGEILIELIKRIPGFKTKVAVKNASEVSNFDPAAIVVGQKGNRIKNLSNQINGEKIEIIKYSDDLKTMLLNLCSNNIVGYKILTNNNQNRTDDKPHITLVVSDESLPIIIGKKGFNIKLIANMLNATVDIHTIEQAKALNIEYDKVEPSLNASSTKHSFDKYNKPKTNNQSFKTTRQQISNKMNITNEELLDDINNLSEDEIKQLFNIDINNTTQDIDNVKNHTDIDINENIEEFSDSDLSDAFADEIANIINDEEKNK